MYSETKVAVVGGGLFGIVAALKLASLGFSVDLFEAEKDVLLGASGANQFRIHRGYHYPRSVETIESCKFATQIFEEQYPEAVVTEAERYYAIAREGSFLTGEEYLKICKENDLPFVETHASFLNKDTVSKVIQVKENALDPEKMKSILLKRLRNSSVNVLLETRATEESVEGYDFVVVAGYADLNSFFTKNLQYQKEYQYELCEKPVVKLPGTFADKSLVVMDGPFFCLDPYGKTGLHVLGNVVHAIHEQYIGEKFTPAPELNALLHKGIIANPPITHIDKFIGSAKVVIPEIQEAEHVGSFFTVRSVLPRQERTDARPTLVRRISENTVTLFSGKMSSCVTAAEEVAGIAQEISRARSNAL